MTIDGGSLFRIDLLPLFVEVLKQTLNVVMTGVNLNHETTSSLLWHLSNMLFLRFARVLLC